MKTLIVEDDFVSRLLMQELLRVYGQCDVAVNGKEAIVAVASSLEAGTPYDLICMDIMMPEMDGQEALKEVRRLEEKHGREPGQGARVFMTTALRDRQSVMQAFREQCDGYLVKPIEKAKLLGYLRQLGLISDADPPSA